MDKIQQRIRILRINNIDYRVKNNRLEVKAEYREVKNGEVVDSFKYIDVRSWSDQKFNNFVKGNI